MADPRRRPGSRYPIPVWGRFRPGFGFGVGAEEIPRPGSGIRFDDPPNLRPDLPIGGVGDPVGQFF
jgi:hypothetical protein